MAAQCGQQKLPESAALAAMHPATSRTLTLESP